MRWIERDPVPEVAARARAEGRVVRQHFARAPHGGFLSAIVEHLPFPGVRGWYVSLTVGLEPRRLPGEDELKQALVDLVPSVVEWSAFVDKAEPFLWHAVETPILVPFLASLG